MFVASLSLTAVGLASSRGEYPEIGRVPEDLPMEVAVTGIQPGMTRERVEKLSLLPLGLQDLTVSHMERDDKSLRDRLSTHSSSISLSQSGRVSPKSEWDSLTRGFFRPISATGGISVHGIAELE